MTPPNVHKAARWYDITKLILLTVSLVCILGLLGLVLTLGEELKSLVQTNAAGRQQSTIRVQEAIGRIAEEERRQHTAQLAQINRQLTQLPACKGISP